MNQTSAKLTQRVKLSVSFRNKVFLLILGLMSIQLGIVGMNFHSTLMDTLTDQVGTRALIQAREIASDPALIIEVRKQNIPAIEAVIGRLMKISDASFIVVGDRDGIRLSHPVKDNIGLPMQGGDNAGALKRGESYISLRKGSLGFGVRGKTPIIDVDDKIIGVVSVGYLFNRFDQWLFFYAKPFLYDVIALLLLTLIGALLFSIHIKKKMNGMEPSEIVMALHIQKSILKSVYEGLIAVDKQGRILTINDTALGIIGANKKAIELKNRSVIEYLTQAQTQFIFRMPFEQNVKDEMVRINGITLIANRVAIIDQSLLVGWVISFRLKEDIDSLTEELIQVKQYTDNLRVMRHEHANKLSTISGLIEIGDSDAALALITSECNKKQKLIDFLISNIKCRQVAGILLGKYSRSKELGLVLRFDPTCQLEESSLVMDINELSAVLGNLIDNAFEATIKNPESNKEISLLLTDAGSELVIEIADNGCGITPELANKMFTRGVTSKPDREGHGIGLYLINRYVANASGVILVDDAKPQGTIISIFIPNRGN